MYIRIGFIIMIFSIFVFSGCEEYLDTAIEDNQETKLVVEGCITTDTTSHSVVLSRSGDFFEKGPKKMVSDAIVTVSEGEVVHMLKETEPGIYRTEPDVYGIIGKTYNLNILLDNDSVYTASEKIVELPEIDSIVAVYKAGFNQNTGKRVYGYYINYYGFETEGLGNYYLWNLYIDNQLYSDSIQKQVFTSDDFVDGNYIKDFEMFFIAETNLPSDTVEIKIEMFSITKEYYDFLVGLLLETVWKGSPWDGPPANAVSNLSNSALGYFRASDKKTATTKIIKQQTTK
jgi:hypothetical protein